MKLSQITNSFDKKSAFLLGMIYAWPMITKDKKYILAYSSYKIGSRSVKLGDIEKYFILHKNKLIDFLGNEFDVSIDIVENLVALCPNCHRKIHLASDEEKIILLDKLYKNRKNLLIKENINITKDKLYKFYNI